MLLMPDAVCVIFVALVFGVAVQVFYQASTSCAQLDIVSRSGWPVGKYEPPLREELPRSKGLEWLYQSAVPFIASSSRWHSAASPLYAQCRQSLAVRCQAVHCQRPGLYGLKAHCDAAAASPETRWVSHRLAVSTTTEGSGSWAVGLNVSVHLGSIAAVWQSRTAGWLDVSCTLQLINLTDTSVVEELSVQLPGIAVLRPVMAVPLAVEALYSPNAHRPSEQAKPQKAISLLVPSPLQTSRIDGRTEQIDTLQFSPVGGDELRLRFHVEAGRITSFGVGPISLNQTAFGPSVRNPPGTWSVDATHTVHVTLPSRELFSHLQQQYASQGRNIPSIGLWWVSDGNQMSEADADRLNTALNNAIVQGSGGYEATRHAIQAALLGAPDGLRPEAVRSRRSMADTSPTPLLSSLPFAQGVFSCPPFCSAAVTQATISLQDLHHEALQPEYISPTDPQLAAGAITPRRASFVGLAYVTLCAGRLAGAACLDPDLSSQCGYGYGDSCGTCPVGAVCSGGYRITPPYRSQIHGVYIDNRTSKAVIATGRLVVVQCSPPHADRCGWNKLESLPVCSAGHDPSTPACTGCLNGYFQSQAHLCEPCNDLSDSDETVYQFVVIVYVACYVGTTALAACIVSFCRRSSIRYTPHRLPLVLITMYGAVLLLAVGYFWLPPSLYGSMRAVGRMLSSLGFMYRTVCDGISSTHTPRPPPLSPHAFVSTHLACTPLPPVPKALYFDSRVWCVATTPVPFTASI